MQKYIVISDTHIGASDKVDKLNALLSQYRGEGFKVLWLGDNYDIIMKSDVETFYPNFIEDDDIKIIGNHDWNEKGLRSIYFEQGKIMFIHGDLVDFGYGAMRFSPFNKNKTWFERIASKLRRWSLNDVYLLYREIENLQDEEVASFHSGAKKLKYTLSYLKVIFNILKHPTTPEYRPYNTITPLKGEHFFSYITDEPEELVKRILCLYPHVQEASTIVIGHLHKSIDSKVTVDNKEYRIICLNAWTETCTPDMMIINDSGEILQNPTNQF